MGRVISEVEFMLKKTIIMSAVVLFLAVVVTAVVWFSISIVQRVNPELNLGSRGYVPEIPASTVTECSADRVCMEHPDTGETISVPSTCNDNTLDVAELESRDWVRCSPISEEPFIEADTTDWVQYTGEGFMFSVPEYIVEGKPDAGVHCFEGDNITTFVRDSGSHFPCAFGVLMDDNSDSETVREWIEKFKSSETELTGISYFTKIDNLSATWRRIMLDDIEWTFIEEPEGSDGESSFTAQSADGGTFVHVMLPDILLDYSVHEAILSTFEFVN